MTGLGLAAAAWTALGAEPPAAEATHRSHLPMPNTIRPGLITYDAKSPDTKFPPIQELRPPKGAPNLNSCLGAWDASTKTAS